MQAVYLESEPFSVENGLLTPTQKLKRVEARDRYRPILDEMYRKRPTAGQRAKL
jgi:long-chain acyl-CoA synthetase